jgi:hypothetical protein
MTADKGRRHAGFSPSPPAIGPRSRQPLIGPVLANPEGVSSTPDRPGTRVELLLGLVLAMCVHPYATWRTRSTPERLLLLSTYFAVSYILVIGALLLYG